MDSQRSKKSKKKSFSKSKRNTKKKTNITLDDYDDMQERLLKREESMKKVKELLLQKEQKKKAATRIQSATRGRQSRKKTDWKKRTEPIPFPFEKRILTNQILGNDIETIIDKIEKLDKTRLENVDLLKTGTPSK